MDSYSFVNGSRIYLRNLEQSDIKEEYRQWFNNEEVCMGNSHRRFPMLITDIARYIEEVNSDRSRLVLAIIKKKEDIHIGNVALQNINYINRSAEFAIIIGSKEFQNMGYGREASSLIIKHGFFELNLHRIYCGTIDSNEGMKGLAVTLGFKREGVREEGEYKNGKYLDVIEYGLLRKSWNKKYEE